MKVFVTGGTGFIGGHVVRKLIERGNEVVALVRDPAKTDVLAALGATLIEGDLNDEAAISQGMKGCDAVIHGAAIYKVGIPKEERQPMYEANVLGTERVLRAALEAEIPKVVYVSTIAAFGNTHGKVVDETYVHPGTDFTSYYEETKYKAHQIAKRLIEDEDLPCVILQPGGVYGPKDHSTLGDMILQTVAGKLPLVPFPKLGLNLVHVEDVADGVLLGLDKGEVGEAYVLGGTLTTNLGMVQTVSRVAGRKPPRGTLPAGIMKAVAPVGALVGPLLGYPPNMRELISSADGVTFTASHDKAIEKLGYSPRGLEDGLRETLTAEGKL